MIKIFEENAWRRDSNEGGVTGRLGPFWTSPFLRDEDRDPFPVRVRGRVFSVLGAVEQLPRLPRERKSAQRVIAY